MKFTGSDFMQKVQRQQEIEELKQRLDSQQNQNNSQNNDDYGYEDYYEPSSTITQNDELQDIAIKSDQQKTKIDKKKLVFLGLFLGIVFVFTIIVIRFFMNYSTQNDLLDTPAKVDEAAIEQKFAQIVTQAKDINSTTDANGTKKDSNATAVTPVAPATTNTKVETQNQNPQIPASAKLEAATQIKEQPKPTQPVAPAKAEPIKPKAESKIDKVIEKKQVAAQADKRDMEQLFGLKEEPKQQVKPPKVEEKKEATQPKEKVRKVEQKVVEKPKDKKGEVSQKVVAKQMIEKPKTEVKVQPKPKVEVKVETPTITQSTKYIQLGSFSTDPKAEYLDKIKQAGYSYKINKVQTDSGVIQKIVVGPFDEPKAREELAKIKSNIAAGAFIAK